MKPRIFYVIYLVLGMLALASVYRFYQLFKYDIFSLYNTRTILVVFSASTISLIGLVCRYRWARLTTSIAFTIQAMSSLLLGLWIYRISPVNGEGMLISILIVGFALLFLAYQTFFNQRLKSYLSHK